MCTYIIFSLEKSGWVTTFWERVAHSVDRMFSLLYVYLYVLLFPILLCGHDLGSDCIKYLVIACCYLIKIVHLHSSETN